MEHYDSEDKPVHVISIASDAARVGQPQEDTMLYACADGHTAGWLPPMVHGDYCGWGRLRQRGSNHFKCC